MNILTQMYGFLQALTNVPCTYQPTSYPFDKKSKYCFTTGNNLTVTYKLALNFRQLKLIKFSRRPLTKGLKYTFFTWKNFKILPIEMFREILLL